ncbi:rcc01693 family protein [Hoeflea ulvae]|uniref:Phage tail assembly chaperone n=1 Tax=Hoeflea ulvae TaxID=2983764 RepID=A0ABT3YEX1_9HYPH|nr:rcc01693 family protein [Hoeflea ulvae]MCY0094445.1 phage tail assembly chaperone [Hoeflea ulvae]
MTKPERAFFPWASVIRFGLSHLRLPPDAFWRLSLPELSALVAGTGAPQTATRRGLEALMAQFPDTRSSDTAFAKEPSDGR